MDGTTGGFSDAYLYPILIFVALVIVGAGVKIVPQAISGQ